MLTANCCMSLRSGWGTLAQLEVYAVSGCSVLNGDFTFCVSVCQLVLVCPGYDRKLRTLSAGANDLYLLKRRKTTNHLLELSSESSLVHAS